MKNYLIIFLFSILFTSLTGCNGKIAPHDFGINDSVLNSQINIVGVIKYTDDIYGDIYLQFQSDGQFKLMDNYEGKEIQIGNWNFDNDVITIEGETWIKKINVLEINENQIKFSVNTDSKDTSNSKTGIFLLDNSGNRISNYSGFEETNDIDRGYEGENDEVIYNNQSNTSQINSENSSSSSSIPCTYCNKIFSKYYLTDRCETKIENITNPGYVICDGCHGRGFLTTNVNCNCPNGIGWCYEKDCPVSLCEDGWIKCSHCNGTGQSR
jgi:hypothetical protein